MSFENPWEIEIICEIDVKWKGGGGEVKENYFQGGRFRWGGQGEGWRQGWQAIDLDTLWLQEKETQVQAALEGQVAQPADGAGQTEKSD